ncbi:MAG TPA: ATP-binding protein [Planctomycetaceae bacterium]|jgi:two-component system sensor histidine kinase DctS
METLPPHVIPTAQPGEDRLQKLIAHAPIVLFAIDANGVFTLYEGQALKELGRQSGEIVGRSVLEMYGSNPQVVEAFRQAQAGESFRTVVEIEGRAFEARNSPLVGVNGEHLGTIGVATDVTERVHAERQTRRMLDELSRVGRISTMREMAAGLAHELNQPLAAIVAYVDACLELVGSGRMNNQQLSEVLRSVSSQAERAGRIIHRLRQMIKRDQPSRAMMSINEVIGETIVLLESAARQAGVTIHMELDPGLPELLADFVQVQQVVFHLVHNAIDAMSDVPQNRRRLTVATARNSDREIEIAVRDLGHGLTDESAARLFEPFFSTSPNGLGLGLSISRTIIEAHAGRIDVSPNSEAGVTARFTLPVNNEKAAYASTADCVHR